MMDEQGFAELIREIESLGYDRITASRYAVIIGDTPLKDETGKVIVRDSDGTELAKLSLKFYS